MFACCAFSVGTRKYKPCQSTFFYVHILNGTTKSIVVVLELLNVLHQQSVQMKWFKCSGKKKVELNLLKIIMIRSSRAIVHLLFFHSQN